METETENSTFQLLINYKTLDILIEEETLIFDSATFLVPIFCGAYQAG
jgi:hypothetical protein